MSSRLTILGAGAFGSALAARLAVPAARLLGRVAAPPVLRETDALLLTVPSDALEDALVAALPHMTTDCALLVATKGLVPPDHLPLEAAARLAPARPLAVLSGPAYAAEIAAGLPAHLVLASHDLTLAQDWARRLCRPGLVVSASNDPVGVQLLGAAKNVVALAAGAVIGARLGENARAALLVQAFAELGPVVTALGGQAQTLMGPAGLGDLLLTATSTTSRNTRAGLALGAGEPVPPTPLVEGIQGARRLARHLARGSRSPPPQSAALAAAVPATPAMTLPIVDLVVALLDQPSNEPSKASTLLKRYLCGAHQTPTP